MSDSVTPLRTSAYKPALAWFAAAGSAWVFVLVTLGAFTTSIGAGMAFPDWPLSDGSINPPGWLQNIMMFAEHAHRLSAMTMGLITIVLAVWLHRREERAWLRRLGWWALGLVVLQGVVGGMRVLLNGWHVPGLAMTVGEALRLPHGILAQVYVCVLIAIAVACSRGWIGRPAPVAHALPRFGKFCCGLALVQLAIAVTMRDNHAGLAIPVFPYSAPGGGWLPAHWSFGVALNFSHRVVAGLLAISLVRFAWKIHTDGGSTMLMNIGATALVCLLALQILLGAEVIWTARDPVLTTGHVLVGALLLATTFGLTWLASRDGVEAKPSTASA